MAEQTIDLTFLGQQNEKILAELGATRQDNRQIRAGFTSVSEYLSRLNKRIDDLERRIIDMREETEAMIKLEIGGSLAHLETRLEERMAVQLDEKLGAQDTRFEAKFDGIGNKFAQMDRKFAQIDDRFDKLYVLLAERLPR